MPIPIQACETIPADQTHTAQQLVKRTETIVLARANQPQSITGDFYSIELEVLETLKGTAPTRFTVTGFLVDGKLGRYDYNRHNDMRFWAYSNTGNFSRTKDCRVFGHFERGRDYLVFIEEPYHPRSFEVISSLEDDSWLADIRKILSESLPPK